MVTCFIGGGGREPGVHNNNMATLQFVIVVEVFCIVLQYYNKSDYQNKVYNIIIIFRPQSRRGIPQNFSRLQVVRSNASVMAVDVWKSKLAAFYLPSACGFESIRDEIISLAPRRQWPANNSHFTIHTVIRKKVIYL